MSNDLRTTISDLAATFATSIVKAIRSANLDDILALADGAEPATAPRGRARAATPAAVEAAPAAGRASKGGRLQRRSPEEIAKSLDRVVGLLKTNKGGLRAEQIRVALKMQAKEMPRVLKEGLSKKSLKSKGQKRSTTYTAA